MRRFAALNGIAAVMVLGMSLGVGDAMAGGERGMQDKVKKRGCNDLVHLKHPNLKGQAFLDERDKCVADGDAYGK